MKDKLTEYDEWAKMSPEEKKKQLYLRQKNTLDLFLERHAIDQKQYDKCLYDLIEKMKIYNGDRKWFKRNGGRDKFSLPSFLCKDNFTLILHLFGYGFYSTAVKYNRSRENRQIKANNKSKGDFEDEKDY